MARYAGPKCRLCRREGMKLFLKGTRCESEKCAMTRRKQSPGQHGTTRKRPSSYGIQLREKQRAKRIYGILEKQFKNYVGKALREKESTSEVLMQMLELRLDNVVYRAGFALSRPQARQLIRFGYFAVNGRVAMSPSFALKAEDVVSVVEDTKVSVREEVKIPGWLGVDAKEKKISVVQVPKVESVSELVSEVNPQLIVEFYSR